QSLCHGMVTKSSGITKVVIQTDSDGPGFADVAKEPRFDPTMEGTYSSKS
ncbi:hypothetical protein TNCV_4502401, partial [Trichonephila clavipes]